MGSVQEFSQMSLPGSSPLSQPTSQALSSGVGTVKKVAGAAGALKTPNNPSDEDEELSLRQRNIFQIIAAALMVAVGSIFILGKFLIEGTSYIIAHCCNCFFKDEDILYKEERA